MQSIQDRHDHSGQNSSTCIASWRTINQHGFVEVVDVQKATIAKWPINMWSIDSLHLV